MEGSKAKKKKEGKVVAGRQRIAESEDVEKWKKKRIYK